MTARDRQAPQPAHTPGPWIAARHGLSVHTINADDGAAGPAVCMLMTPSGAIENHEANTRLIAAAPELLAVVQEMFSLDDSLLRDIYGSEFVSAARAAIAKATGAQA